MVILFKLVVVGNWDKSPLLQAEINWFWPQICRQTDLSTVCNRIICKEEEEEEEEKEEGRRQRRRLS